MAAGMIAGRLPVSRSRLSTVFRQTSNLTPCAIRLSTRWRLGFSGRSRSMPGPNVLDGDLVGIVGLQEIIGDADDKALFLRVVIRKLQGEAVFGEGFIG
jgi:hypothetical protein